MSRHPHRRVSLLVVALLSLTLVVSHGGIAHAQSDSGEVAVDRHVALALKAMSLWANEPGVFVDLGYGNDDGIFVWTGQVDGANGMFRLGHILHVPGVPDVEDSMAYRQLVAQYRRAFPDLQVTVEDVIQEENQVMLRWTMDGTHTASFGALAPTGTRFQIAGVTIFRTANGQITETWFMPDALGLVTQIATAY